MSNHYPQYFKAVYILIVYFIQLFCTFMFCSDKIIWKKKNKVSGMINFVTLQGLGIAFVVTRVNELNSFLGSKNKVWDTEAKWQLNCYRLLLIGAIMCSVCSLLACVFLAAASCMWGHKVRDLQINFTNWFKNIYNKYCLFIVTIHKSYCFFYTCYYCNFLVPLTIKIFLSAPLQKLNKTLPTK